MARRDAEMDCVRRIVRKLHGLPAESRLRVVRVADPSIEGGSIEDLAEARIVSDVVKSIDKTVETTRARNRVLRYVRDRVEEEQGDTDGG